MVPRPSRSRCWYSIDVGNQWAQHSTVTCFQHLVQLLLLLTTKGKLLGQCWQQRYLLGISTVVYKVCTSCPRSKTIAPALLLGANLFLWRKPQLKSDKKALGYFQNLFLIAAAVGTSYLSS